MRLAVEPLEDRSVPATLTLTIPATSMSEAAGPNAVGAFLNRTGDLSQPLTVNLTSSDTTEATVPPTASFAVGQTEVGFSISAVDDVLVDGTQTVTITGTANVTQGQPFGFDLSYGSGGLAPTRLDMAIQPPVQTIALQQDGKAIVASENSTDNGWHVQRFNTNGTLDTTFGGGLVNTTDLGGGFPVPYQAIVRPNGKILIGGKVAQGTGAAILVQYNSDGTLDTSFGNGGKADLTRLTNCWVTDIALRPDGRILLGLGQNGSVQSLVAQLNANGTFDATFGSNGVSALNLGFWAQEVEVLADGTFLVGGSFRMPVQVAKVQPNGIGLVTSFGTNGVGSLDFGTDGSEVAGMVVDSQGRIIVGADVFNFVGGNSTPADFAAGRLNPNGTPDTSFAGDGTAVLDGGGSELANALVVQQDGKVVVAGRIRIDTTSSVTDSAMVRFNENGTPDTTFDGDGFFRQSIVNTFAPDQISDIVLQEDGKLLAITGWGNDWRIARFHLGQQQFTLSSSDTIDVLDDEGTNRPPVTVADRYTLDEDTTLTVLVASGVLANDSDPDGNPLTASLYIAPRYGRLTLNANGSFTYTPQANFYGQDDFVYFASDGRESTLGFAFLTVNPVNDLPVAADNAYTVAEDTVLTVGPPSATFITSLSMVSDAGDWVGQGRTYNLTPANGTFTASGNANFLTIRFENPANSSDYWSLTFAGVVANPLTPGMYLEAQRASFRDPGHPGMDITGQHRGSNIVTGFFNVLDAAYDAATGQVLRFAATFEQHSEGLPPGLRGTIRYNAADAQPVILANDRDPDGDPMSAVLVDPPAHGTVTLRADGSFTYTPASNYNGPDSFTYRANDGRADSNLARVTINVTAVNDPPTAVNDTYLTTEDTALTVAAPGVLGNDTDVDGNALTAVLVSGPSHGTLTLNSNGSFTYTPAADYNGPDSFSYKANDGALDSKVATVAITVRPFNDPPVAREGSATTAEDTALNGTVTATDPDGDALTFAVVTNPAHGTVTLTPSTGAYTYTPAANYNGPDSFTFKANDGQLDSNVASVSITVTPVNDPPVAQLWQFGTPEDTSLSDFLRASDVDGDPLTFSIVSGPANGFVQITNTSTGTFIYRPNPNYNGTDSFTFRVNDGQVNSNVATVFVTVTPVNDAPVAANDAYTTPEDTTLQVAAPGVLGNDSDVEGSPLTAILVAGPSHGTLTLSSNGSFTYTPAANYNGPDSFTYKANDGALDSNVATVSLSVNPVNDAPVAVNDAYSTNEDTALTVAAPGVLANDSDIDGNPLTAVLVTGPNHGTVTLNGNGSFTYTPAANYNGPDSFTYRANDGAANSNIATVNLTVNPVNDAPVAVNDAYDTYEDTSRTVSAPGVLANDSDIDGNALTAILVSGPSHGTLTLNSNGSFSYTPAANYNGPDSFTYKANDGTADSNVATVSLSVNPLNDAPVAANDAYSTNEDTPLTVAAAGVLANDSDVEDNPLTAVLVSGPSHGTVTLNSNGSFTYTPAANYNGPDSFTYRANDGAADSNVATVSLTVNPVNDAPVAANDAYSTAEDTPLTVAAPSVLANDSDVEESPLTAILVTGPGHGTLTLNSNGSFTYTPAANYNGPDSFTYRASDGTANSNLATVSLTVNAVNDAPVAANDAYSTNEDTALTVAAPGVLGNDSDIDGNPLTAQLVSGPANGTLTLNPDGSFTYTPAAGFVGTDTFTYRASDGTLDSNVATVTLLVNPANQPGATVEPDPLDPTGLMLVVRGTSGDDNIDVKRTGNSNQLEVTIRSATFNFAGTYPLTFTRIVLYGLAGNDDIRVQDTVTLPAWLYGDEGNDRLQGGGGPSVLVGGDGDDQLQAGRGRGLLIGGRGSDKLQASGGDTILIAGFTDHDANALALGGLMAEWMSSHSPSDRVANLSQWLNASTVHDDGDEDLLIGGTGLDCYFASLGGSGRKKDRVNGARLGEIITDTTGW